MERDLGGAAFVECLVAQECVVGDPREVFADEGRVGDRGGFGGVFPVVLGELADEEDEIRGEVFTALVAYRGDLGDDTEDM